MDQNFDTVEEWKAAGSPEGDLNNNVTIGGSWVSDVINAPPDQPPIEGAPTEEPNTKVADVIPIEQPSQPDSALTLNQQAELDAAAQVNATERANAIASGTLNPEILGPVSAPAGSIDGPNGTMITPMGGVINTPGGKPVYPDGSNVVFNPSGSTESVSILNAPAPQSFSVDDQAKQNLIAKINSDGGLLKTDSDTARQAIGLGLYRDAQGVPLTMSDYTRLQKQDEEYRLSLVDQQIAQADKSTRDWALSVLKTQAPNAVTPDNRVFIGTALASGVDASVLRMLNLPQDKITEAQDAMVTPKLNADINQGIITNPQVVANLLGVSYGPTMGPAPEQKGGLIGLISFGTRKALFGQEGPLSGIIAPAKIGDGKYGYLGSTGVIPLVRDNMNIPIPGLAPLLTTEASREAGFNVTAKDWTVAGVMSALQLVPFFVKLPTGGVTVKYASGTAIEDIAAGRATGVPVEGVGQIRTLEGKLVNIPVDASGGEQFAAGLARSNVQDLPIIWENGSGSYLVRGESGQPFKVPMSSLDSLGRQLGKVVYEESGGIYRPSYYIGGEKIPIEPQGGGGGIQPAVSPFPTEPSIGGIATKIARGETLTAPEMQVRAESPQLIEQELQRIRLGGVGMLTQPTITPPQVIPGTSPSPVQYPATEPDKREMPILIPSTPVTPYIATPIVEPAPGVIPQVAPTGEPIIVPGAGVSPNISVVPSPTIAPVAIPTPATEPNPTTRVLPTDVINPVGSTTGSPPPPPPPTNEPLPPSKPTLPFIPLGGSGSIYRSGDATGDVITTSLSGQVRDLMTNLPIPKALVRAISSSGAKARKLTDKKGYYKFRDINPDRYTVITEKAGYDPIAVKTLVNPGDNRLDIKPRQTRITTIQGGQTTIVPLTQGLQDYARPVTLTPSRPGVIALKRGREWAVIYPPYQPNNLVHMLQPPEGATIAKSIGQMFKLIQSMGGNGSVLVNLYQGNKHDDARFNKRMINVQDPVALEKWLKKPGRGDVMGKDTPMYRPVKKKPARALMVRRTR